MKLGFFLLFLIAFTLSTLGRSFAFAGQDNVVKIEISHSHNSDHHHYYPIEQSHESEHTSHDKTTDHHHERQGTSAHGSESDKHHHTHTHEILVSAGHAVALVSKVTLLSFELDTHQFPLAFTQGHLLDRPLDSIFRPPIRV